MRIEVYKPKSFLTDSYRFELISLKELFGIKNEKPVLITSIYQIIRHEHRIVISITIVSR